MQQTKHGIPCNIPTGFNPRKKVNSVRASKMVVNPFKHFAELTRLVDGKEQTVIGPVGKKEHKQALADGYKPVREWTIN